MGPHTDTELSILRLISSTWSTNQWEAHLQSLENQGNSFEELLVSEVEPYERYFLKAWIQKENNINAQKHVRLKELLKQALTLLPHQQQVILRAIFWDGLSSRKIAKSLNTTRWQIDKLKHQALQSLEHSIQSLRNK